MDMGQVKVVFKARAELAEGPVWFNNFLWWVDILAGTLNKLDVNTGSNCSRAMGKMLGAAVPCSNGKWLLAHDQGLSTYCWKTGKESSFSSFLKDSPDLRFNDGKCDPLGRFFGGTVSLSGVQETSSLFLLNGTRPPEAIVQGVTCSNGLAWSEDASKMYYIDSQTRRVDVFDYDKDTCQISQRCPVISFLPDEGVPDGMTIDEDDNLWVAMWGGRRIYQIEAGTGKKLRTLELPVSNPTSCIFDGRGNLYVTSAWEGKSLQERIREPLAGSIFSFDVGLKGRPVDLFKGDLS